MRANPALIGGFVIGGLGLALLAVVVFGSGKFLQSTHEFVVYFSGSVNGLNVGAPVKFKGVTIGSVKNIMLRMGDQAAEQEGRFFIPVIIELDEAKLLEKGARAVDLGRREVVEEWIRRGLRAQLATESFVTGVLYVALDYHPDTEVQLVNLPGVKLQEIPVIPTPLEQARTALQEILDRFEQIKLKETVDAANEALRSVHDLVQSPGVESALTEIGPTLRSLRDTMASVRSIAEEVGQSLPPLRKRIESTAANAEEALDQARETLKIAGRTLEPGSPLTYQLGQTLRDVGDAARAVRALAEYLERNPGALLRGKGAEER
jgi:paraquat-inducible protein B